MFIIIFTNETLHFWAVKDWLPLKLCSVMLTCQQTQARLAEYLDNAIVKPMFIWKSRNCMTDEIFKQSISWRFTEHNDSRAFRLADQVSRYFTTRRNEPIISHSGRKNYPSVQSIPFRFLSVQEVMCEISAVICPVTIQNSNHAKVCRLIFSSTTSSLKCLTVHTWHLAVLAVCNKGLLKAPSGADFLAQNTNLTSFRTFCFSTVIDFLDLENVTRCHSCWTD